jgi:hypothetical protein
MHKRVGDIFTEIFDVPKSDDSIADSIDVVDDQ